MLDFLDGTGARSVMQPNQSILVPFVNEVLGLHAFLQRWLKGEVARGEGPSRLENALEEDFVVVHPNGALAGRHHVIRSFSEAYGSKGIDYALRISDVKARAFGDGYGLVTYREDHGSEDGRSRISTALLRLGNERVTWLFLQETLISAARGAASAAEG